ncbi:MAG: hypothetical protein VCA37_15815 [Roseibacillus sp.]
MKNLFLISVLMLATYSIAVGQVTSENNKRLKNALAQYPDADANKDGVLTLEEGRNYLRKQRQGGGGARGQKATIFKPSAEELQAVIAAGSGGKSNEGLKFEKGNGIRVVMTGHSWVAPGRKTLPDIAAAAGFKDHHQQAHLSGGGTGAANAIWLKEFGKYDGKPPRAILVPAIATGQWDVMTWGGYYQDKPEYFTQWIDLCLDHNPKMTFCLQDGWPRYDAKFKGMANEEILSSMKKDYAEFRSTRSKEFFANMEKGYPGKVCVIPAGAAVIDLIERFYAGKVPDFDCVDEKSNGGKRGVYRDGGHLSRSSGTEWLVGYLYYGMLYKKSPELIKGFHPKGVPPGLDKTLREVAWKAITESPFSRITDKDGDGAAD